MNFLRKSLVGFFYLWVALAAVMDLACAVSQPPADLRELAAHAADRSTWPRLRTYAKAQPDSEWSGWAFFLAGYREYGAQLYPQAAQDLAQAALSGFPLADYAVFYQASSLRQSNRAQDAAVLLEDFSSRFPLSRLRNQVLELRAGAWLSVQQAQPAIDALSADRETHKQPALALLLAQAYLQGQHLAEAATAFQNVYYNFPLSSQVKAAADALTSLRTQMGSAYPEPVGEWKMARADALFKAGRFADALIEYTALLKAEPSGPMASRWQLDQARCLWHLQRSADALQALASHYDSPELESQRLALLVHVHAQQSDEAAFTQDLAQLEASYSSSPAFAEALSAVGAFYYRQFNWQQAAGNYRRLWALFPQDSRLREDGWRLGWCDYLLGDAQTADVLHSYLMQYPGSSHTAAALYWLGRVEEDQGVIAEARALYALLVRRFAHTYYAPQAAAHLATLRLKTGSVAGPNDSAVAPLAAALIPVLTPPAVPPGLACAHLAPSDAARPALILQALELPNLEQDFLRASVGAENPPAELRLLLAESYSAKDDAAGALFGAIKTAPGYAQMQFSDLPQEVWDLMYPRAFSKIIKAQARLNNLDPYLVMGLIRQESAFTPHALSPANARGLMQVLPQTAAKSNRSSRVRVAGRRLYDPNYNVQVGCAYLAQLLKEFDGKPEYAMAAYNAGDFRVKDWMKKYTFRDEAVFLESIPFSETRSYVEWVLRDAEIYRQLLSGAPHFAQCSRGQAASAGQASGGAPCDGTLETLLHEDTQEE